MTALRPRYWFTLILLGCMRICAWLPYPWLLLLGKGLGGLLRFALPQRRWIANIYIDLCFPEKSARERRELARRTFHSMGLSVVETALAWWGAEDRLKKLYT